ncbi:hypothetical protein D3C72_1697930 [compost metagenome]
MDQPPDLGRLQPLVCRADGGLRGAAVRRAIIAAGTALVSDWRQPDCRGGRRGVRALDPGPWPGRSGRSGRLHRPDVPVPLRAPAQRRGGHHRRIRRAGGQCAGLRLRCRARAVQFDAAADDGAGLQQPVAAALPAPPARACHAARDQGRAAIPARGRHPRRPRCCAEGARRIPGYRRRRPRTDPGGRAVARLPAPLRQRAVRRDHVA